jgi:EmrB/QacA subfamily drug resistance transporter
MTLASIPLPVLTSAYQPTQTGHTSMTALNYTLTDTAGRWVLFCTVLASSMAFIDGSALNVALPALQDDLGASGADLLWIINAYMVMLASLLLLGGSLGDHLGRKRIFSTGIGLFSGASLVCGVAPTTAVLIAARVVQGIGGALMVPGSLAIISASFASTDRGKAIGLWSSATTVTTLGGPILGGILADAGLWRFVFFINLPLAVLALVGLSRVPETRDDTAPDRLDIPGALLTVLGLAGLTYGLITLGDRGVNDGIRDPLVLAALIAGAAALMTFVLVERRSDHPLVDLHLFQSRTFSGANLMTAFLYGALYGGLFFLTLNMIQVQGYDAAVAALALLPFDILLALISPWAGGLVDRIGPRIPLTVGPVVVGISFAVLALPGVTGGPADFWTTYFPGTMGIGLGMGIIVAPLTTTVMGSVSSRHAGTASGINNAVSRQAQVVAIAVFGAIALGAFGPALDHEADDIPLTAEQRAALDDEATNLGDAKPPAGLDASTESAVTGAIHTAFVDMFRVLMGVAVALCGISAGIAALLVENRLVET